MYNAIEESFRNGLPENALFLAELQYSRDKSEDSVRMLAKCYKKMGRVKGALELLRGIPNPQPQSRYDLAMCCLESKLYGEAERVLTQGNGVGDLSVVPNGEYGLHLLGRAYRALKHYSKAATCFKAALRRNPFLWVAYEALCDMGLRGNDNEDFFVQSAYAMMDESSLSMMTGPSPITGPMGGNAHTLATPLAFPSFSTPNTAITGGTRVIAQQQAPAAAAAAMELKTPATPGTPMFGGIITPPGTNPTTQSSSGSAGAPTSAQAGWMACLRMMAVVQWHLSQYRCEEALQQSYMIQYESGWLWSKRGRALAELGRYQEAAKAFDRARAIEPYRIEGMEAFSTVLWHLGRDAKLSYLAHELTELDRLAPQTWCVVGNCFSLQQEHDVALRFFKRANQVDPAFTYAYTLSGHEFVANDDLEQASSQFRAALQLDPRHYNAWYGLGMIFYRTQNLDLAGYHFDRALKINPFNSALRAYRGMVYKKQQQYEKAMAELERSIELNPKNVFARSKKAQVMIYQGNFGEALKLVNELLKIAPTEAFLYFLQGTIFRSIGQRESAVAAFTEALDRDNKNSALIKTHLERIYAGSNSFLEVDEEDEDVMMDFEI